jgi:hypothetical protein
MEAQWTGHVTSVMEGCWRAVTFQLEKVIVACKPVQGNGPYKRNRGTRHIRGDITQQ